jgi:RecA-family ATPase
MIRDAQVESLESKRLFPSGWLDDARPRLAGSYLIKGLIDEGANVVVYGPSGSGKTFLVIDLACHIAAGMPWRGRRVKPGLTVYIAAEAGESIVRRFTAWRDHQVHVPSVPGQTRDNVRTCPANVPLLRSYPFL